MRNILHSTLIVSFILCIAAPNSVEAAIHEGDWEGSSGIEFTVVNQTTINPFKVTYTFTPPPCSGSITVTTSWPPGSGIQIVNGSFTRTWSYSYPEPESGTITGTFSPDGNSVQGHYEYQRGSCYTESDWSAVPVGLLSTNPTGTGTAIPSTVEAGSTTLLVVDVTPGTSPSSTGISVIGNLVEIGGSISQPFYDDGTNGDETSADSRYSFLATVDPTTMLGTRSVGITISDEQARSSNTTILLTVTDVDSNPPLSLNDNRFLVEVDWSAAQTGESGQGVAVPLTSDSGYFWFFGDTNVEILVKILDGRTINGYFWFFWGAMTDVEYIITVTDTQTGAVRYYYGTQGIQQSGNDINAFSDNP